MKYCCVQASECAFGMEAGVLIFANEHGIHIASRAVYDKVKKLMKLIDDIDKLTAKKVDIALLQTKKRNERDQLKKEVGWGKHRSARV